MGFGGNYGGEQAMGGSVAKSLDMPRSFTQRDRINQAVAEAEQRLAAAKRAAEILEKNPDIEELLNLLGRF